ncbi:PREDICTED: squalene synthase-like [Nanorana parkeri]|uniref:squalene synthase-like n=1 Tax=Nanorana parkeri TaxID=125878 RepID=UPI0008544EAB|nr:PREDICTED: squalene synthase-like [Nanorana parkeri]
MELLRSLGHPEEMYNLIRYKVAMYKVKQEPMGEGLRTCYKYLNETGRSYAAVIQALDGELRNVCCIFYLVLRAMDTVEDDPTISLETKIPILENFHTFLYQADWSFTDSKKKDRQVLEDFPTISREFRNLAVVYQEVIIDAIRRVAQGMAEFLQKEVESVQDWDEYCYYVSSSLTRGLSVMFGIAGLEGPIVGEDTRLSNSMGLFMQKTNIIRDYLGDQLDGREFWPKEVWSRYGKKLSDLAKPENIVPAVHCLNELITNAMQHAPDVLLYLSRLRNQIAFKFCAVPLVMAVATLAACYNNQQVFKGVVKIRKGQAVTLMMDVTDMTAVRSAMRQYAEEIIPVSQECLAFMRFVPLAGVNGALTTSRPPNVRKQPDGSLLDAGGRL